jgi:6-phosphogluconolactonase/glucosamine-6-phosphate isomerase/deaminase
LYGRVTTQNPASFLQLHPQVSVLLDELLANQLP